MQAYEVCHSAFEAHDTCNSGLHIEAFIFVLSSASIAHVLVDWA